MTYHQSPGINRSRLFNIAKSPEYFKYCEDNPRPPSHDLIFGQAFHKLALQPHEFEDEFAVAPDLDMRYKESKSIMAEFDQKSGGKTIITQGDFDVITAMRHSLEMNPLASFLVHGDVVEEPIYWTDPITGELCKCKPDSQKSFMGRNTCVDLKSCRDASEDAFARDALKYGYDLETGMYLTGLESSTGEPWDFVFVCVEKTEPHTVNMFQADDFFIQHGQNLFRRYLDLYHKCKTEDNWPGYMGFENMINNLSVPSWIAKQLI